jgi:hypothetical protein
MVVLAVRRPEYEERFVRRQIDVVAENGIVADAGLECLARGGDGLRIIPDDLRIADVHCGVLQLGHDFGSGGISVFAISDRVRPRRSDDTRAPWALTKSTSDEP